MVSNSSSSNHLAPWLGYWSWFNLPIYPSKVVWRNFTVYPRNCGYPVGILLLIIRFSIPKGLPSSFHLVPRWLSRGYSFMVFILLLVKLYLLVELPSPTNQLRLILWVFNSFTPGIPANTSELKYVWFIYFHFSSTSWCFHECMDFNFHNFTWVTTPPSNETSFITSCYCNLS